MLHLLTAGKLTHSFTNSAPCNQFDKVLSDLLSCPTVPFLHNMGKSYILEEHSTMSVARTEISVCYSTILSMVRIDSMSQ